MGPNEETNHGAWTTGELKALRGCAHLGAPGAAKVLGRTVASVKKAAYRHRISLRRKGSRRGSVLGQPRGVSLPGDVREAMVTGAVDQELIARRMQIESEAELCPSCGRRPQRTRTGLCVPCHKDLLIERYRECIDELVKERLVNRLKQQKKRLRDGHDLQAEEWLG